MTKFQALFIKVLRVRWEYSYRAIHREWQVRYVKPEDWHVSQLNLAYSIQPPHCRQSEGMDLVDEARRILNEDWGDYN